MGNYATAPARARKELPEEARRLGISVSELTRRALEEEVRRRRLELEEELKKSSAALEKISVEEIVQIIREYRETRAHPLGGQAMR